MCAGRGVAAGLQALVSQHVAGTFRFVAREGKDPLLALVVACPPARGQKLQAVVIQRHPQVLTARTLATKPGQPGGSLGLPGLTVCGPCAHSSRFWELLTLPVSSAELTTRCAISLQWPGASVASITTPSPWGGGNQRLAPEFEGHGSSVWEL